MAKNEAVERIIDSLAFEVEAVPQDNILEVSGTSKSTPLNLKIKVRKKDEAIFDQGVVSVPKLLQPKKSPEQIRLVNSDQTVLSFKVYVDTDPEKKPVKKRKRFFGACLSSEDNDGDDSYTDSNNATQSGEIVKLNFGLSKNVEDMQLQTRKPIMFFGNTCKPGGCLDPAFGEDNYSYEPNEHDRKFPAETELKKSDQALPSNITISKRSSIVESLDKTSSKDEILPFSIKSDGISNKNSKISFRSSVGSKTSFRNIRDSSLIFSKSSPERKVPKDTKSIIEEHTPDSEKILTKLYPEEIGANFQSKTNSSIQDLKENDENLVPTLLAVGGALTVPILIAGAATQITKSREDTTNEETEKRLKTPQSTKENINILRLGDENQSTTGTLIHSEKDEALTSPIPKTDEGFDISKTKEYTDELHIKTSTSENDYKMQDQKFEPVEDKTFIQSEKSVSIKDLSGEHEMIPISQQMLEKVPVTKDSNETKNEENYVKSKVSNEIRQTTYDVDSTQEPKDEIRSETFTGTESQNKSVDEFDQNLELQDLEDLNKIRDGVYNKNFSDFGKEYVDDNLLKDQQFHSPFKDQQSHSPFKDQQSHSPFKDQQSHSPFKDQQFRSPEMNINDADKISNISLQEKEDLDKLTSTDIEKALDINARDDRDLKVDFIDDSIHDMNYDKIKFKGDQTTDSILSSRDGSKFRLKKDFINMNLAFQSYVNDQNESVIKSLDTIKDIKRQPQDNVTIIKSQLKINTPNVIKVPIDTRNYMMLEVKASDLQVPTSSRPPEVSADLLGGSVNKENYPKVPSHHSVKVPSEEKMLSQRTQKQPTEHSQRNELETFQYQLLSTVYDKQLIPLQRLISDLKKDVEILASEQLWLKENCRRMKKSTTKLTHSNRKCACSRK